MRKFRSSSQPRATRSALRGLGAECQGVRLAPAKGAGHVAWYSHIFGFLTGIVMTPIVLEVRKREVARDVEVPATGYAEYAKPAPS